MIAWSSTHRQRGRRITARRWFFVVLAVTALAASTTPGHLRAQTPLPTPMRPEPADYLLPSTLQAAYLTRAWVRDSLPTDTSADDTRLVDLIYLRALTESRGDPDAALLASLIAVFEHRGIPLTLGITIPLSLEPDDLFRRRVERLPRRLFADRPKGDDSDKLQHFFASALLTRIVDQPELADLIGIMVERGEAALVRGGADDPRDIRANRLGQLFAELLDRYPHLLPGAVFRGWNRRMVK